MESVCEHRPLHASRRVLESSIEFVGRELRCRRRKPVVLEQMLDFIRPNKYAGLNDLYVSDDERGQITLLKNQGYAPDGAITAGINGPFGVTLDTGRKFICGQQRGRKYHAVSSG